MNFGKAPVILAPTLFHFVFALGTVFQLEVDVAQEQDIFGGITEE